MPINPYLSTGPQKKKKPKPAPKRPRKPGKGGRLFGGGQGKPGGQLEQLEKE